MTSATPARPGLSAAPGLAALLLLAFALRLPGIASEPMWIDEAASLGIGSLPWTVILGEFARVEASPPGYYLLAALAERMAPDPLLALRLVSILAATLACLPLFLALRAEGEAEAAWFAAIFLALAATLVRISVDARAYALLTLCLALGFQAGLALARGARNGRRAWRPGLLLGLAMAVAIWLHATAGLLALGLNLAVLAAAGRGWRAALAPLMLGNLLAIALAAWPILFILRHLVAEEQFITRWISPPGLRDTLLLYARTLVAPWQSPFSALTALLFALGAGRGAVAALRRDSPAAAGALALAGFGLLAFPLVSQWRPVMIDRTLLPLVVPLAALAGIGFVRLGRGSGLAFGRRPAIVLAGLFLALQAYGALQLHVRQGARKEGWPALAAHHAAQARPGEALVIPDSVFAAIAFADAARRQGSAVPPMLVVPAASPLEQAAARHLAPWAAMTPSQTCAALRPRAAVWVAHRPMPPTVRDDPGFTTLAPVVEAIEAGGARPDEVVEAHGLRLRRWSGPVCPAPGAAPMPAD